MTKPASPKNIVLYADDDHDDLDLVKEAFSRYTSNVEVITATDGIQALQYLQKLSGQEPSPCLIILDVNMPILNGKEVLKRIREMDRFSEIPVVLFTTSSLPQDKHYADKYNAGFITKPIEVGQMEEIAEIFIDHCSDEIRKNIRKHFR